MPPRSDSPAQEETAGCNLYIANLSFRTSDEDLHDFFAKHGDLRSCKVIKDPTDNRSRGFGFATYSSPEEAERVVQKLTTCELDGRALRVEKAKRGGPHPSTPGRYLGHSYRKDGTPHSEPHTHSKHRSRSPRRSHSPRRKHSRSPKD